MSPWRRIAALAALILILPAAPAQAALPTAAVALGDSFISGEGVGAYRPVTDANGQEQTFPGWSAPNSNAFFCHRSANASLLKATPARHPRTASPWPARAASRRTSPTRRAPAPKAAPWPRSSTPIRLQDGPTGTFPTGLTGFDKVAVQRIANSCVTYFQTCQESWHPNAAGHAALGQGLTGAFTTSSRTVRCVRSPNGSITVS